MMAWLTGGVEAAWVKQSLVYGTRTCNQHYFCIYVARLLKLVVRPCNSMHDRMRDWTAGKQILGLRLLVERVVDHSTATTGELPERL